MKTKNHSQIVQRFNYFRNYLSKGRGWVLCCNKVNTLIFIPVDLNLSQNKHISLVTVVNMKSSINGKTNKFSSIRKADASIICKHWKSRTSEPRTIRWSRIRTLFSFCRIIKLISHITNLYIICVVNSFTTTSVMHGRFVLYLTWIFYHHLKSR